jgi:hypothetical protein
MTLREWFKYYRRYYRTCSHRSHRLRLKCWRWYTADGFCAWHNSSCWYSCDPVDQARILRAPAMTAMRPPRSDGEMEAMFQDLVGGAEYTREMYRMEPRDWVAVRLGPVMARELEPLILRLAERRIFIEVRDG